MGKHKAQKFHPINWFREKGYRSLEEGDPQIIKKIKQDIDKITDKPMKFEEMKFTELLQKFTEKGKATLNQFKLEQSTIEDKQMFK